jgi:glucose/mannose transport system substrate-binding protein
MLGRIEKTTGALVVCATLAACGGATKTNPGDATSAGAGGTGAGAGGAGGTGGGSGGADVGPPMLLDVYTWLVTGNEAAAFNALIDELRRRYPRVSIVNSSLPGDPRTDLLKRIAAGNPPDSFQIIIGADTRTFGDEGALQSIDALSAAQGWSRVFPKVVLDAASRGGALLGVPLDVERSNTLFYNTTVLQSHGVAAPASVDEFFKVAEALKSQGVTPIAVSATGGWTIASQLFESVLVAEAGPDFVEAYLRGQKAADAPEIQKALGDVGRMMDYANPDRATTGWSDAVKKVCAGEAAMLFLPDFVKPEFANQGCGPDRIGYVAMEPAGTPTFVFVSIGFTLPNLAAHRDSALAFLEVVGSVEGQRIFNTKRGYVPARTDVPAGGFDPISSKSLNDFAMPSEHHVLGYAAAVSESFQSAVNPALQAFVDPTSPAHQNVATVLTVLKQNYPLIAR